jgi:16S rRNA G966 N2-methylase RsmD
MFEPSVEPQSRGPTLDGKRAQLVFTDPPYKADRYKEPIRRS